MIARVIACIIISVAGVLASQQQPPTFRSGVDVVTVDVSVRDRIKVINGLTAADFVVLDNGVRQELIDVSYDKLPIDVTVALDVSKSVTGDMLKNLRAATVQLMKDLGAEDRLRLVTFNARVHRVMDFTSDIKTVERAVGAVSAGGGTSIFDTITTSIVSADQAERRQLLVLFTDGLDSTSITEPLALYDIVDRMNVAITTVMPTFIGGARGMGPAQSRARVYARLANDTGGQMIPQLAGGSDLGATFRRALEQFRSTYALRFVPKGVDRGGFHTLTVTVPGRNGLSIRARRGYSVE